MAEAAEAAAAPAHSNQPHRSLSQEVPLEQEAQAAEVALGLSDRLLTLERSHSLRVLAARLVLILPQAAAGAER